MKKNLLILTLTVLATTQVACNASNAPGVKSVADRPDVSRYLAQKGWKAVQAKSVLVPVSDIVPVVYMAKGDSAPSCGLLAQIADQQPAFFDIQTPEPDSGFPQCLAINDAATFDLRGRKYLAIEYINRDTTEDFYRQYFYVYKDARGQYVADEELNDSPAWPEADYASADRVNPPRAKDGVRRAKGTVMSKAVSGMEFIGRDFIAGDSSSFAVFHDKAMAKCAFVVDTGAKSTTVRHEVFSEGDKCIAILASSRMEHDGITFYLALFKGVTRNRLALVSASKDHVIAGEGARAVAAARTSKLSDMKTAKQAILATLTRR